MTANNYEIEQRSIHWHGERFGMFTGSAVWQLMVAADVKKDKFGDTALKYIYLTGRDRAIGWDKLTPTDRAQIIEERAVSSKAIQWGIDHEDEAAAVFDIMQDKPVRTCGSIKHASVPYFAASPDRLVGEDAILEIKCVQEPTHAFYEGLHQIGKFNTAEHLKEIEPHYYWQTIAEMLCTGRTVCHFLAYFPKRNPVVLTYRLEDVGDDAEALVARIEKANELCKIFDGLY